MLENHKGCWSKVVFSDLETKHLLNSNLTHILTKSFDCHLKWSFLYSSRPDLQPLYLKNPELSIKHAVNSVWPSRTCLLSWRTARSPASLRSHYGWLSRPASAVRSSARAAPKSKRSERWVPIQQTFHIPILPPPSPDNVYVRTACAVAYFIAWDASKSPFILHLWSLGCQDGMR